MQNTCKVASKRLQGVQGCIFDKTGGVVLFRESATADGANPQALAKD